MKRNIICLLLIFYCLTLFSCTEHNIIQEDTTTFEDFSGYTPKEYVALEIYDYDCARGKHSVEFILESKAVDVSIGIQKTFMIHGEEKTLVLSGAGSGRYYGYGEQYSSPAVQNKLPNLTLWYQPDTNAVTGMVYRDDQNLTYEEIKDLPLKTRDECYQKAYDLFKNLYGDIEAYSLAEERHPPLGGYPKNYTFVFKKCIDGIRLDECQIKISAVDNDYQFTMNDCGGMKNATPPSIEILDSIQKTVNEKIYSIYDSVGKEYELEVVSTEIVLVRLADGRRGLEYFIDIKTTAENSIDCTDTNHYIVILD